MNIDMDENELLKLDNQLCFAVYSCSRAIINHYRPYLKEVGLTYTQYITMLVLWETPSISSKDLGNKLYLDSGTLTPLLKKLENMGLVQRKRDIKDERNLIIHITDAGRNLKEVAKNIPLQLACDISFSPHEMIFIRESLKSLTQNINKI